MTRDESHGTLRPLASTANLEGELAEGARLLERVGALQRSEQRKRRVWNALQAGNRPPMPLRLRSWHLAMAGVLFTAASSAAVGGYYVTRRPGAQVELAAAPPSAKTKPAAKPARRAAPVVAAAPLALDATPSQPSAAAERPLHAPARGRAAEPSQQPKPVQTEAEAQLLVEAMRARREGNSQRVSELVDEYRSKHPNGSLQEEALILSIESAVSRHAPNAAALSREYLKRFPNGRFAAQARRAASTGSR